jgi:magnesium chelatase family protein
MLAQITSGAVLGVDAYLVRVEVDLGRGLPSINVVGLAENAVREGRERVLAAMANEGFIVPPRRITINLAPATSRRAAARSTCRWPSAYWPPAMASAPNGWTAAA